MRLVVSGASGFIGSALCSQLLHRGHTLSLLSRAAPRGVNTGMKHWYQWRPGLVGDWESALDGADGVINLAGEPIANKRWSPRQKRRLRLSRIDTTVGLVRAMAKAKQKPKFFLNASAVGYYGPRGEEPIGEEVEAGTDFLAQLCREWEAEAKKAEKLGVRVICLRTGIALGPGGGALAKMIPPFKFFVGGPLGTGKQWMSWIHLDDLVGLILHLIENNRAGGPVNATAPNPVTMKEFCRTLGQVMHRPSWLPVPSFALRLLLGEMAQILLTGQKVVPTTAQKLGYQFRYPNLPEALRACLPR